MWDKQWRHFTKSAATPANAETIRLETVWSNSPEVVNTFRYDTLGHLISESQDITGHPQRTTHYGWSAGGVQKEVQYPATGKRCITNLSGRNVADTGLKVTRELDKMSKPLKVSYAEPGSDKPELLASQMLYDSVDGLPRTTHMKALKSVSRHRVGMQLSEHLPVSLKEETDIRAGKSHHRVIAVDDNGQRHPRQFMREHRREWPYDADRIKYVDCKRIVGKNVLHESGMKVLNVTQFTQTEHHLETNSKSRKSENRVFSQRIDGKQPLKHMRGAGKNKRKSVHTTSLNGLGAVTRVTQRHTNSYSLAPEDQRRRDLKVNKAAPLTLPTYPSGWTFAEPGATTGMAAEGPFIDRNVFGQPVAVSDAEGATFRLTHDAGGRVVLKDTPSQIKVDRDRDADVVIDVVGGDQPTAVTSASRVHARVADVIDAIRFARRDYSYAKRNARILVRIHPGVLESKARVFRWMSFRDLWVHKHITFEELGPPKWEDDGFQGDHVDIPNATFRGFRFRENIWLEKHASNVVFDGCTFEDGLVCRASENVTVQNCIIRGPIEIRDPLTEENRTDDNYVFAHNIFDVESPRDPIAVKFPLDPSLGQPTYMTITAYNNIVIRRDANDKGHLVIGDTVWPNGKRIKRMFVRRKAPFNDTIRRRDYPEEMFDLLCEAAYNGSLNVDRGTGDVPPMPGYGQPALWDKNGYLRDWRNPTPGPIEALGPQRADRVIRRYVYGGGQLVQRETYRDRYDEILEITRTIQTAPGTSAPVAWHDSDGVIDVQMRDRKGMPLWTYRAREGKYSWDYTPDLTHASDRQREHLANMDVDPYWENNCRRSGILAPLPLPGGKRYMDYPAWHLRAIESDHLMGRRGVLGWNRATVDQQLMLPGSLEMIEGAEPAWYEKMLANAYENPWQTAGYIAGGAVLVVGGVVVTVMTGGFAGFVIGGAIAGFGMGFGMTGAITNDFGAAFQAGAIGAIAGAVGGAASFGVLGAFGGASAVGGMSLLSQMGVGALAGGAGGFTGGFAGGTLGTRFMGGQSWGDSLYSGLQTGAKGALYGAAFGAAVPLAIAGGRALGRGAGRLVRRLRGHASANRQLRLPTTKSLDGGTLGETDWQGNVTLRAGMSREMQRRVLLHESVHRSLTARSGRLASYRQALTRAGYSRSHLLRGVEEMLAEGYSVYRTTGSIAQAISQGFRYPFAESYVNAARFAVEAAGYSVALGGMAVGGYYLAGGNQ